MNLRHCLTALIGLFAATAVSAQEPAVTPNKPDEPRAAKFSMRRAAQFIDDAAVSTAMDESCASDEPEQ